MRPYYRDRLVTIYDSSAHITKSEVVVLDPPTPMKNIRVFKAKIYIIFTGSQFDMYASQLPKMRIARVPWLYSVGNDTNVYKDTILVAGNTLIPGESLYLIKPLSQSAGKWDRPLELLLNLLTNNDGDVLDPFMGGGNTLVAAKMLGRKSIGFDIDKRQCKIAAERCAEIV